MSSTAVYARVRESLEKLRMEAALKELDDVLQRGVAEERSSIEVLDQLLKRELSYRFERRVRTNFKLSGLPVIKRLEDFNYEAQPQVPKRTVEELQALRFLHNGENVLFLGPCGVGKTHLAIGLGVRALEDRPPVYFASLHDLVAKMASARERHSLARFMHAIHRADLWILDELGFLPLSAQDATFVFELVNKRYQSKKSTIINSNKTYTGWSDIFPDPVLATALLDCLYEVTNEQVVAVFNWGLSRGELTADNESIKNKNGNSKELLDLDDIQCQIIYSQGKFSVLSGK
jgi:DNA replication protein DnaC